MVELSLVEGEVVVLVFRGNVKLVLVTESTPVLESDNGQVDVDEERVVVDSVVLHVHGAELRG